MKTLRELSFSKLHCDSTHSTEPMCVSLSSNCLEQPRSFFHVSKGCCEAEGNTAAHLATGRNHIKVDLWLPKRACAPFWVPTLAPGNGKTWQDRTVGFGFPVPSVLNLDGIVPVTPCGTCKNGFCPTAFLWLAGSPRREGWRDTDCWGKC